MEILEMLDRYWPLIVAAGVFLDAVAGYLPDRWVPYLGMVKRIVGALRGRRELAVLFLLIPLIGCAGMPTIQFQTATQEQVANLAVSIGAKAIGLKLRAAGFMWTDEIETFYKLITTEDQLSLDAAQMAEKYIRANVDPLIAPDVLELARMIGVKFDAGGNVIGTGNVRVDLLKTAAAGFRMAVVGV